MTPSSRITLEAWLKNLQGSPTLEVEARFLETPSKQQFGKCMKCLVSRGWKMESLPEMLDVATQNDYRTTIYTPEEIARFSKGILPVDPANVLVIQKKRMDTAIELGYVRINSKMETPIEDEQRASHMASLVKLGKTFRLKKRFKLSPEDPTVHYHADFTIVKTGGTLQRLPEAAAQFEIELEAHPGVTAAKFIEGLHVMLTCLEDGFQPMSASEKDSVLQEYIKLTFRGGALAAAKQSPRSFFAGPQPVTMTLTNLEPPSLGKISILEDYTVTDKCNGERQLLLTKQGRAYLINNRLNVRALPVTVEADTSGCLLDGEFVELPGGKRIFAAFDIYLDSLKDVRSLPLMAKDGQQSRLTHLVTVIHKIHPIDSTTLSLMAKNFRDGEGEAIFDAASHVLRSHKAGNTPYDIDGLIFTPKSLSMGASDPGPATRWGGTWLRVLKWKPPQENTIDFMVRFGDIVVKEEQSYRILLLHVGYNTSSEPRSALSVLGGTSPPSQKQAYVARLFQPEEGEESRIYEAFLPINSTGKVQCVNGEMIENDFVVEFAYAGHLDNEAFSSYKWVPVRLRSDKYEEYKITGKISANNHKNAVGVWQSIVNPVTEKLITGQDTLDPKNLENDTVYYAKIGVRDVSATKRMRLFHNVWIKDRICLQPFKALGAKSLLDLACGKGGDLRKWIEAGFMDVLGLDLFQDNINNPVDGAYARLSQSRVPAGARYAFVPYYVSKPVDAAHINTIANEGDRMVLQNLWALVPKHMVHPKGLARYYGLAAEGFDVVSCQFAIHYFFKDDTSLDNFSMTVARNLRPGGRFVGTCMDGRRVASELAQIPQGSDLQEISKTGQLIFSIRRLYSEADAGKELGRGIGVYLESINTTNIEYLVDYEVLKKKMESVGLTAVAHAGFQDIYDDLIQKNQQDPLAKVARQMTDSEKKLSFMNMWFAFEKTDSLISLQT